jgi:hypothetical protein
MRSNVKTLRNDMRGFGRKEILGGWRGLKIEMRNFFQGAKVHSKSVVKKQMDSFKNSQAQSNSNVLTFDRKTGNWSKSPTRK